MKLITFQTFDALKSLINNGELICDERYIDLEKSGPTYNWVLKVWTGNKTIIGC